MDYEKKYKEALEKLRDFYRDYDTVSHLIDVKEELANLIPELKESENERIIKFISNELACLRATEITGSDRYEELTNAIAWLEKQGEQKPAEWTMDNIEELTEFENAMMHIGGSFFGENAGLDPNDTNAIKEQANFLLELVPSKEWSEEDENRFNNLIFLVECSKENEPTKKGFINFIHRLKSTNYQKQWKPTEEQLDIIDMILTDEAMDDNVKSILKELKGQLKKLREE